MKKLIKKNFWLPDKDWTEYLIVHFQISDGDHLARSFPSASETGKPYASDVSRLKPHLFPPCHHGHRFETSHWRSETKKTVPPRNLKKYCHPPHQSLNRSIDEETTKYMVESLYLCASSEDHIFLFNHFQQHPENGQKNPEYGSTSVIQLSRRFRKEIS